VTFAPEFELESLFPRLKPLLGEVDAQSGIYVFDFTGYYEAEMGQGLHKVFLAFDQLMHPARLAFLKNATNQLEMEWAKSGKRRVNIDPGYLSLAKLVVASAKDFAHRIYLGQGIYGDLQLQFKQGAFHVQPWTFPDYQTEEALNFFKAARNELLNRIQQ
jgi:hypothetical protein